VIIENF